jgi:flagellar biosynthesis protein FlhA
LAAIDADLNAGLIDEKARRRRKYLEDESGFCGAMDGASRSCAATPSPACSSC